MKKLILSLFVALSTIAAYADGIVLQSLTATAASNILSGAFVIQNITVLNTSTNVNTVSFWDNATNVTNVVRGAYTKYVAYSTNFSQVFTNEANVVITNTYVGLFTGPTAVSAITNAAPTLYVIMCPPSTTVSRDIQIVTTKGLTAVPSADCQVAVTYKGNP